MSFHSLVCYSPRSTRKSVICKHYVSLITQTYSTGSAREDMFLLLEDVTTSQMDEALIGCHRVPPNRCDQGYVISRIRSHAIVSRDKV